jgi:hypothetical protein
MTDCVLRCNACVERESGKGKGVAAAFLPSSFLLPSFFGTYLHLLACRAVDDHLTTRHVALVHAHIRELAEAALLQLERQRHRGLVLGRLEPDFALVVVEVECPVVHLRGVRQVIKYAVEHGLHTAVLVSGAEEHRHEREVERGAADGRLKLLRRRLLLHEEHLSHLVVHLGQLLQQRGAQLGDLLCELGGDFGGHGGVVVVLVKHDDAHFHDVDDTLQIVLQPDGCLDQSGVEAEFFPKIANHALGIGAHAVQLVDERDARHIVALHLPVHSHSLRLHSRYAAQHQNGTVQHTQGPLHLDSEVNVAFG